MVVLQVPDTGEYWNVKLKNVNRVNAMSKVIIAHNVYLNQALFLLNLKRKSVIDIFQVVSKQSSLEYWFANRRPGCWLQDRMASKAMAALDDETYQLCHFTNLSASRSLRDTRICLLGNLHILTC
jgi:hypothetical protein